MARLVIHSVLERESHSKSLLMTEPRVALMPARIIAMTVIQVSPQKNQVIGPRNKIKGELPLISID